ncbi:hypothetical protein [Psychroserpens ponticola]|uniref:Uncharacterized protein n=1 Tax=Psychroserpens ponticola TaxID=2932268 RepID=A0ABY7S0Y8_9FLAO|nr:hypothetical protein [Psychroserpens ponticola]WCO02803.1 hypothetical protein MUN68_004765 [Psychroserpens ponticola]
MKNILKLRNFFALIIVITLLSCSDDDSTTDDRNNDFEISYVGFTIAGPITNGDYEYRDVSSNDEFSTLGYFYNADEDPDLSEDEIQLYIGKSFTESNFLLVSPPEIGIHNIGNQNGDDSEINIVLESIGENYNAKEVSVTITELEINGDFVTHCKGTFTGEFYRNNSDITDVHEINGDFEINN